MKLPAPSRRQGGIALIESMLAIVILGVGLLGTVGLQARAYSALADAGLRAEAAMAAEKLIGTMSADLPNVAQYNLPPNGTPNDVIKPWADETRTYIPGAQLSVAVTPLPHSVQVDISITWQRKAKTDQNSHVVTSYISI